MIVQPSLLPDTKPKVISAGEIRKPNHFAIIKRLIAESGHQPVTPQDKERLISLDHILRAGGCARPIRLLGAGNKVDGETGEILGPWSTNNLPGGFAYVACKTRRKNKCAVCSWLYQGDAYQLIVAGLRGGKDTSEEVAKHPALFVTFTAPSFGKVHTQRKYGKTKKQLNACNKGNAGQCIHGNSLSCNEKHSDDDRKLGQPLCGRCYDYESAVMWNAYSSELWRRTRIGLDRELAKQLGIKRSHLKHYAKIQYVKVAEFQRRGLVHFHMVIRVDGPEIEDQAPINNIALTQVIEAAMKPVKVKMPNGKRAKWGTQCKMIPIVDDNKQAIHEEIEHTKKSNE